MKNRSGFTLIELLIVVAILAVLLALLSGGIKKSMDNAKKRNRATEVQTLETAISTYWHDTGKPPVSIKSGVYSYSYREDNNEVFAKLLDPSKNPLKKKYLDMNQMRTANSKGNIRPMEKSSESIADYKGQFYKVTINLKNKTVDVQ